jgi:hypothetical protein
MWRRRIWRRGRSGGWGRGRLRTRFVVKILRLHCVRQRRRLWQLPYWGQRCSRIREPDFFRINERDRCGSNRVSKDGLDRLVGIFVLDEMWMELNGRCNVERGRLPKEHPIVLLNGRLNIFRMYYLFYCRMWRRSVQWCVRRCRRRRWG